MSTAEKVGLIAVSAVGIGAALFFVMKRRQIDEVELPRMAMAFSLMTARGIDPVDAIAQYNAQPNPWVNAGSINKLL